MQWFCPKQSSGARTATVAAALGAVGVLSISSAHAQAITSPKGYSIVPAHGWQNKPGTMGADMFIFAKPAGGFSSNLNVVVTPTAPGDSLKKLPAQMAAAYPKMFTNYHSLGGKYLKVGGHDSYESSGTYEMGTPSRTLRLRQDFVIIGSKAYVVTCTAPNASFATYTPAFNAMVKSMKFTGG